MMRHMALWQDFLFSLPGLITVAFYGAAAGSFLNVVVYRIPRGISIVLPRSRCPRCCLPIRPWHNLPVIGWILLKAQCRDCQGLIPARYPIIEALTAALFVGSFLHWPDPASAVRSCVIASWALALGLVDFDRRVLPDSLTLPAIGIGLVARFAVDEAQFLDGLMSSVSVYLGLTLLARFWQEAIGEEGFGAGDIRFLAALGAVFGVEGTLVILLSSTILAVVMWLSFQHRKVGGKGVAFGAALSTSTIAYLMGWIPGAFQ